MTTQKNVQIVKVKKSLNMENEEEFAKIVVEHLA